MDKIETDSDYRQRLIVREEQYCRQVLMPDMAALKIKMLTESIYLSYGAALDEIGDQARLSAAYPLPRINVDTFVLPEGIVFAYTGESNSTKGIVMGKIAAIKLMREHFFMGLKQAKDVIEFIVERDGLKTWDQANSVPEKKTPEQNLKQQQADFMCDAHELMYTLTYDQLQEVIDAAMRQQRVMFLTLQEQKRQDESERSVLKKHLKDV